MSASASTISLTLTGLKALTTYAVVLTACRNEPSASSSLAVAVASGTVDTTNPDSYLTFSSRSASSSLASLTSGGSLVKTVLTGEGVPLARSVSGGKVRLFFEATGADGKTRVMSIDSKDGYFGQDFNSGSATTSSTAADYATGGGCAPTMAIAVEATPAGTRRF